MGFTKLNGDMGIISALPDRPTPENGFTAARIKELFDKSGVDIKEYINTVLIPELESAAENLSGADKIGHTAIDGLDGRTVGEQLNALKSYIDETVTDAEIGLLPNGSVTAEMLSNTLMNSLTLGSNLGAVIFKSAGQYTFTAPKDGIYRLRMVGGGGNGTMNIGERDVTVDCPGGASAGYIESFVYLKRGSKAGITVGAGGHGSSHSYAVDDEVEKQYYNQNTSQFTLSQGGESVFGSDEVGFFIHCPGASNTERKYYSIVGGTGTDLTRVGYIVSDTVLFVSGVSEKLDITASETSISSDGADSKFGCGGTFVGGRLPDAGSGGAGGRWQCALSSQTVKMNSGDGGDGMVIIEYVGL